MTLQNVKIQTKENANSFEIDTDRFYACNEIQAILPGEQCFDALYNSASHGLSGAALFAELEKLAEREKDFLDLCDPFLDALRNGRLLDKIPPTKFVSLSQEYFSL